LTRAFFAPAQHLHLLCAMPYWLVSVLWDGTVVACCQDYDGAASFGNLREQSLKEIWEGDKLRRFREQWKAAAFSDGHPCAHCRWLPKHYVQQARLPQTDAWWEPLFADEPGPPPERLRRR
jgi:radical SAM protein with 4Fe4S-binding SPASM domain